MPPKTLLIGAGLTALTIAHRLRRQKHPFHLLEARPRPGGRVHTDRTTTGAPIELGATWLGRKHTALVALLDELGLPTFEQRTGGRAIYEALSTSPPQVIELPPNDEPSYRIAGGSDSLIRALLDQLPAGAVTYGAPVSAVTAHADHVEVRTADGRSYRAATVVSTLPPNLLVNTVTITPALPDDLLEIARRTHTWMGDSIKVGLRYDRPFWRHDGRPGGTLFSNVGPVTEMYDHTTAEEDRYGLKGFLDSRYYAHTWEERREMVLTQLRRYYGPAVDEYTDYVEGVWRQEAYTFRPHGAYVVPHQHNGHPIFRSTYLDGRLLIAGSETADQFPGYMDGAVRSGNWAAAQLLR